jgi:hypothetical protein
MKRRRETTTMMNETARISGMMQMDDEVFRAWL